MESTPLEPFTSLTPELTERLREQTLNVLSYLVKTNSATTYFKESAILPQFRAALHLTDGQIEPLDFSATELFEIYRNNVGLSIYEDYFPVISRLFERQCNMSSVENLMAPGLPVHTARLTNPQSNNAGKNCSLVSLTYRQVVTPLDGDGDIAKHIPVCLVSSGCYRIENSMPVENDAFSVTLKIPRYSSPIAISLIPNYKSGLFMHALFALAEPKLETISIMFTTACRDLCRTIDNRWEDLIHCIETGVITDLDGIAAVKDNLQDFLQPNPDRVEELRRIGKTTDTPGWFRQIWPQLRVILANASGPFATLIPEIRHYAGPDVSVQSVRFLAVVYDPRDLNLYSVVGSDDVIEFLPVDKPEESKYLAQSWNVELGRKYEVVLTTRDGFWRYRLGDVVEIAGFNPRDGPPLISMHIRLANEMTTETQLRNVIDATSDLFGGVSEFCVSPDYRQAVARYAFFVELQGDPGANISAVPTALHDQLQKHNENYLRDSQMGKIGVPCVRVVQPGTFGDYRGWKVATKGAAAGQVKVAVVIWVEADRAWLEERVMYDI
ncbi:GH3 auxin-responsive promoter-domain-containing protein [Pisolithus tinctorius]|nr:GH3 auxin-responsive promoter-domain-containing protein [Pisolithus tinctorius]